jgi:SAM-dependent methyltransferase
MSYLETTHNVYKEAALTPDVGLCCTTNPIWELPGLKIPRIMQEMNYGCGSTVHARDLTNNPKMLYVGVGGGMELLQFAYFNRNKGGVIGLDVVDEMLEASRKNFKIAEEQNDWFQSDFVDLRKGDAMDLPVEDNSIDVAAQNCLFNIFKSDDLKKAIEEMYRVLKPHGKLVMSDPTCLSGSLSIADYVKALTDAGFGTIEIRARKPYRILDPKNYPTEELIYIESIEVAAIKDPMPADGPCIFTGRAAIYYGDEDYFDDGLGHTLLKNQPLAICDKTTAALQALGRDDIFFSESTFHYDGGGCC